MYDLNNTASLKTILHDSSSAHGSNDPIPATIDR